MKPSEKNSWFAFIGAGIGTWAIDHYLLRSLGSILGVGGWTIIAIDAFVFVCLIGGLQHKFNQAEFYKKSVDKK